MSERPVERNGPLAIYVLTYAVASLLHFGHNAKFLSAYPNLPRWLTAAQVWAAWIALTGVGAIGVLLARSRYQVAGLIVLSAYACFGFDGLGHYAVASPSAHTPAMNLTIWLEAVTAALLLLAVARAALPASRARH